MEFTEGLLFEGEEASSSETVTNLDDDIENIVNSKLSSKTESDESGFQRKIFALNGKQFSFRGLNELPVYPTLQSSKCVFLGEESRVLQSVDTKEYERYKTLSLQEGPEHYLVNKTAEGVVDLAIKLGGKNRDLFEIQKDLKNRNFSPQVFRLIDSLLACNLIENGEIGSSPTVDAEALVLLSLLGDKQAENLVLEKLKDFYKKFSAQPENEKKATQSLDQESLEKYCIVQATGYEPERSISGDLIVSTTFDATDGVKLRNTIHTSISHRVLSHAYGSWEGKKFTIIAPLKESIKKNGLPYSMVTTDTFWEMNPGEKFVFPKGLVVKPGQLQDGYLMQYKKENLTVEYKAQDYKMRDLLLFKSLIEEDIPIFSNLFDKVRTFVSYDQNLTEDLRKKLRNDWDFDKLFNIGREGTSEISSWDRVLLDFHSENNDDTFTERIKAYIKENMLGGLKDGVEDVNIAVENLSFVVSTLMTDNFRSEISSYAVKKGMEQYGFKYDSYNGRNSDFPNDFYKFVRKYNIDYQNHDSTRNAYFIKFFQSAFGGISFFKDGKLDLEGAISHLEGVNEVIPEMTLKSLRVMYLSGIFNSRVKT